MAKTVTLTKTDYDQLINKNKELETEVTELYPEAVDGKRAIKKLDYLEAHGVDNWSGYGEAMDDMYSDEADVEEKEQEDAEQNTEEDTDG